MFEDNIFPFILVLFLCIHVVVIATGLNPSIIGAFSGLCAFMGVTATFVSTKMVNQLGILKVLFLKYLFVERSYVVVTHLWS